MTKLIGSTEVGTRARPSVRFGVRHHAGTDRIALRIGQGGPEVEPVERAGEEAVLPEVSGPARADVVVLGVTAVDAPQQDGQRVLVFWNGDEVDVIGHQAEADDPDTGTARENIFVLTRCMTYRRK